MITIHSKISEAVLSYFFLHPEEELYVNEMARRFHLDCGNLTRKLRELEREGILKSRISGKQKYYSLNTAFALYEEYRQIVLKTVGIEHRLREALKTRCGIQRAFLFGSYATNTMDIHSDIDLFVITRLSTLDIYQAIAGVEESAGREINVVCMDPEEFTAKQDHDPFVSAVLRAKVVELL